MIFSMLIYRTDYQILIVWVTLIAIYMMYNISIRYMSYIVFSYCTMYQQYHLLTFTCTITEHT